MKKICESFQYAPLDDSIILQEAALEPNLFLMNHRAPLLINEVQKAPCIFRYLKMYADRYRTKGIFALAGSEAFAHMNGVDASMAGRLAVLELQGLSLREIHDVDFHKPFIQDENYIAEMENHLTAYPDIWETIHRGSMPELQNNAINRHRYYASYIQTYIERDVRKIIRIDDRVKFFRFLTALASRCGERLNINSIANEAETSADTIKRWISVIRTSGIIFLLEPYYDNVLKRIVKTPKVYFHDTGLVCYLTRWTSAETARAGAQAGNLFENFIVSEIFKSHLNAGRPLSSLYRD